MFLVYLIACLPVLIGAGLWIYRGKNVVWQEWLLGSAAGFLVAIIFHAVAVAGLTHDVETWSGRIVRVHYQPYWEADWWETQTYQCGDAKHPRTCTRLVHRHENHQPYWEAIVNYGEINSTYRISKNEYSEIVDKFGGIVKSQPGYRPHYESGDRNDYYAENHTNYTFPANTTKSFENRVKAAPSIFSFAEVPETVPVFEWPESDNWRRSNRLLGTAPKDFSIFAWDQMNAELGPSKLVNVICVGFEGDSMLGQYQQAKWVGGKKNDLVICYGPKDASGKASWVYVFGWTDKDVVKKNLEELFLNNEIGDSLIPKIKSEIKENYVIKHWEDFDYLSVEPPTWSYVVLVLVMVLTQGAFWLWAEKNDLHEGSTNFNRRFEWR